MHKFPRKFWCEIFQDKPLMDAEVKTVRKSIDQS